MDDVAEIYFEGWRLGLKALAIYRNNCKVGQPLSNAKETTAAVRGEATAGHVGGPIRRRLPKKRPSQTVSFAVAGAEGYLTAGSYPDDGLGELEKLGSFAEPEAPQRGCILAQASGDFADFTDFVRHVVTPNLWTIEHDSCAPREVVRFFTPCTRFSHSRYWKSCATYRFTA